MVAAILLPPLGLGVLGFIHLDDIRRWQWDSVGHWMLLVSVALVIASHALMVCVLCGEPKAGNARGEEPED